MPRFSEAFGIRKAQGELDFVDVELETDHLLFLDPFALSQRRDRWSRESHSTLQTFFQLVVGEFRAEHLHRAVDEFRAEHLGRAYELLSHFREPNETHLGYSAGRSQGTGIGPKQKGLLFDALQESKAGETGLLSFLEECALMIKGIKSDKISDLTTCVIYGQLAQYTTDQCHLHGVSVESAWSIDFFDADQSKWGRKRVDRPVWKKYKPVLLVPKSIVRYHPAYDDSRYYENSVLPCLQEECLDPGISWGRALKSGQFVTKQDLRDLYPGTKEYLCSFSKYHPEVLQEYRRKLAQKEATDRPSDVDEEDESELARKLRTRLQAIQPGSDNASAYHSFMVGAIEFIFFPKLLYPRKEREIDQGRKRIDILMDNGAQKGIFHNLANGPNRPCADVLFECKNYVTDVSSPELDQLVGRISANQGRLGVLCCRAFEDRNLFVQRCRAIFTGGRGLVLPMDDQFLLCLLDLIEQAQRQEIEHKMSGLVAEVRAA